MSQAATSLQYLLRVISIGIGISKRREISAGRGGHADCGRGGAQYRKTGVNLSQVRVQIAVLMTRRWYIERLEAPTKRAG
jgi:hypothetical protein